MGEPGCQGCRELQRRVAELEATVRDPASPPGPQQLQFLPAPLAWSLPSSALPPVVKKPTGRRPGAQPGHPPALRQRLPADRVHTTHVLAPTHCRRCQAPPPALAGPDDPEPPGIRSPSCRPGPCRSPSTRARPTPALLRRGHPRRHPRRGPASSIGPRLAAALAFLTSQLHGLVSGRQEGVRRGRLRGPVALGTVGPCGASSRRLPGGGARRGRQGGCRAPRPRSSTSMRQAGQGPAGRPAGCGRQSYTDSSPVRDSRRPQRRRAEGPSGRGVHGRPLCTDRWVVLRHRAGREPADRCAGPSLEQTSRRSWTGPDRAAMRGRTAWA